MVKHKVQSKHKKSSHHLFLISIFVIVLLLAIGGFILQSSSNLKAIAGEAIQQRIDETKQLTLSDEAAKVENALKEGQRTVSLQCPPALIPQEQHWKIPAGWSLLPWKVVEAQCLDNRVFCYYADGSGVIHRADQLVIHQDFAGVNDCVSADGFPGCDCNIG